MLDWEGSDADGAGDDYYWESKVSRDCFGSRRSLGDFSIQDCTFASKGYFAALCRPHSDVPVVLDELGILGTFKNLIWYLALCATRIVSLKY